MAHCRPCRDGGGGLPRTSPRGQSRRRCCAVPRVPGTAQQRLGRTRSRAQGRPARSTSDAAVGVDPVAAAKGRHEDDHAREDRRYPAGAGGEVHVPRVQQARSDEQGDWREDEQVAGQAERSEEHTSELQSRQYLVCRLLLEKKKIPCTRGPPAITLPNKTTQTMDAHSTTRYVVNPIRSASESPVNDVFSPNVPNLYPPSCLS